MIKGNVPRWLGSASPLLAGFQQEGVALPDVSAEAWQLASKTSAAARTRLPMVEIAVYRYGKQQTAPKKTQP